MSSKTQIAKKALQHLGDRYDIADITEASTEAEQCNLVFEDAVRELLREHPWIFANKFACPAALSGTPPAGATYMYTYFPDAIRLLKIVNPLDPIGNTLAPIRFEVVRNSSDAKVIITEQETPEFKYTQYIADTTEYDQLFTSALEYRIASQICMSLTGDQQLMGTLFKLSRVHVSVAETQDANEGGDQDRPDADWITARL